MWLFQIWVPGVNVKEYLSILFQLLYADLQAIDWPALKYAQNDNGVTNHTTY